MNNFWKSAAAIMLATGLPAAPAFAACEPFNAFAAVDSGEWRFSDLDGSGGVSVGDKRVLTRTLTDADDNPIGTLHAAATIRAANDAGEATALSAEVVTVLDDGAIFATWETDKAFADGIEVEGKAVTAAAGETDVMTIVGGTGARAGATGTFSKSITPEGDTEYRVEVTCK